MSWKGVMEELELELQGAEARLYSGKFLGHHGALAKERFPKTYRHPDLDRRLTRERFKAEARTLVRCKTAGIRTPTVYFADPDAGVLVLEMVRPSVTCRDYINGILRTSSSSSSGKEGDLRLLDLADRIGSVIGRMHANGIIHGDLTTSNILVLQDRRPETTTTTTTIELCLIDFGLSSAEGLPEDMAVDLYVLERAMISTHPNTEHVFAAILDSYRRQTTTTSKNPQRPLEVLKKLDQVRARGRKRTMVG